MVSTKFTHTLLKHHQASRRPSMECMEREKRFRFAVNFVKSASRRPSMQFTKFIHTLLKHHQASQRSSMECMERKRVLKNTNTKLKNK